jgi:rhamnogalacturonyl hydrolase YesR
LRRQLDSQPRTSAGGFWHKQRYPNHMWLDGLYMGAPFYAECAKVFNTPKDFDDVAKQFSLIDQHLYDAKSGLFYHGWDSAKVQSWANPATGASSNFWGRAGGWYAMACVDVLDFLPTNHPARKEIIAELKKVSAGIVKWQDADTGLWWQVMDQGKRDGNYLEATASAMFVYALAKGVNHGYLARDYVPAIIKGYNGIITQLIKTAGDKISLTQCCSVAGLGSSQPGGKNRDGSFNYYVGEPIVENDLKGVGPFILAGIEVQQLVGSPAQPGTVEPAGNTNWISLFDGGDLGGWVKMNGGTFTATNGILHLEGGRGWLRTEKEFGDFVLEAEWRGWETNYNSGFFLRAPLDGNPWATNIWQVNTKQSAIGELLQGAARTVKSVTPPVPTGEWVAFRIEARGTNLSLDVNGQRAWEFHGLEPARGFIGLQAEGRFFDFRNLRITEVAAGQAQ